MKDIARILAASSLLLAFNSDSASAQWSVPSYLYPGRGVTATGDAYLQFATTNSIVSGGINPNPKLFWPTGGTDFTAVAFEFSMADLQGIAPEGECPTPNHPKLRIPIDAFTPSSIVTLVLASYETSANGVIDAGDINTWFNGPYLEDPIATVTLLPGVTYTSLEFDVMDSYERAQRLNLVRPFVGFFLYRLGAADAAVISIQNGGATIVYDAPFYDCAMSQLFAPPAVCFQDFGGGRWVLLELVDSAYDWAVGEYTVNGQVIPTDYNTGYAVGCSFTEYVGGVVPGATDFTPLSSGVNLAAYDISAAVTPPVSATNRVRVTIGYQSFTTERTKEQQLLLYHGPNGANFVDVTSEFQSNRVGNLDGGWVGSIPESSLSPFVLAFAEEPADRGCDVVAGPYAAPMGPPQATQKLGSNLPLKVELSIDGAPLASEADLAAFSFGRPVVHIYDVSNGGAQLVAAGGLLASIGQRWSLGLPLERAVFAAGRTYEARIQIGSCERVPANARFQVR